MRVHVDVVAADVPLRAPVWDGPEAEWRIMLMRFLELQGDTEGGEERGRRKNQQRERRESPPGPSSSEADGRYSILFHRPLILTSCPWSFPGFRARAEKEDEARGSVVVALVWRCADDPSVVESVPDRS